jgi:hypothetical protein
MEHASITFERHHSVIPSLQYSNLYYVAPVFFRAHRNIFSQFVQYWTETAAESAYASKWPEPNDNMHIQRIPAHRSRSRQPASGYRNPWYERPPDVSALSEHFFDSRVSLVRVCPETALMYAVLEDAFLCFQKKFETEQRLIQRSQEAEKWFFSDDSRWVFSFVSVCDALGLEPEFIRKKLKHWTSSRQDTGTGNEVVRHWSAEQTNDRPNP